MISLFNHIGIETGNRKESESISRIGIEIDKIQTIPNPNQEMLEFALSQETARRAPFLPPVEGREENPVFRFVSVPQVSTFFKERAISFCSGFSGPWDDSVRRPASSTLAHDPFCQQPREYGSGTMYLPTHPHRMSQLARHLLLWSHTQFKSLHAVHIPGKLNRAADALSQQLIFPREWRLHPDTNRLIWSRFGEAQVELFASHESSHCQLYFSLTEGPLGIDVPGKA